MKEELGKHGGENLPAQKPHRWGNRPKMCNSLVQNRKRLPRRLQLRICQCLVDKFERKQAKLKQAFRIGFGAIRTEDDCPFA